MGLFSTFDDKKPKYTISNMWGCEFNTYLPILNVTFLKQIEKIYI